jgi:hypothetical protein
MTGLISVVLKTSLSYQVRKDPVTGLFDDRDSEFRYRRGVQYLDITMPFPAFRFEVLA